MSLDGLCKDKVFFLWKPKCEFWGLDQRERRSWTHALGVSMIIQTELPLVCQGDMGEPRLVTQNTVHDL